ncbi:hypothetical protein OVA14_07320 [Agrococcus sp. SL85]|uniref:hypothetical protein n=1 Tax=Agrococcus sp. SL85 TaxID=2995141 RepID=UPI00226C9351|nr:hypothetical protein [Agrococcus sp. SL85]WAC65203.1 hypothetical protein OVA14_07320 [Agrococcus sp. SL85]
MADDWLKRLSTAAVNLEQARKQRDELVVEAAAANVPRAHIATAVGLSRAHVHRLIRDAAGAGGADA